MNSKSLIVVLIFFSIFGNCDAEPSLSLYQEQMLKRQGRGAGMKKSTIQRAMIPTPSFSWDVEEDKPITRIEIRLSNQQIYLFQGEECTAKSDISTGKKGYDTKTGKFKITSKDKDHKSSLYGTFVNGAGKVVNENAEVGDTPPAGCKYLPSPMPNFLRLIDDGTGMHAGFLPGFPASHGCIRLPEKFSEKLFEVAKVGTPVEIIP